MGADDFITKPFDKAELLARMQAIVRRSKGFSQPTLRIGALELNLDSREVTVDGQEVHLTGKEYAILELLVLRKGMVLTKEAFLNHLYGGMDEPEMKIIDVFICKLRKKLALAGADNLIGTVWGRGYTVRDFNEAAVVAKRSRPGTHRRLSIVRRHNGRTPKGEKAHGGGRLPSVRASAAARGRARARQARLRQPRHQQHRRRCRERIDFQPRPMRAEPRAQDRGILRRPRAATEISAPPSRRDADTAPAARNRAAIRLSFIPRDQAEIDRAASSAAGS